jgi:hypothetical protein
VKQAREGKDPTDEEANMPPDMKLLYRAFPSQFQMLNSRLDELDEWKTELSQSLSGNARRANDRNRNQNEFDPGQFEDESEEGGSTRNRKGEVRTENRRDSNLNAIKANIPPFKGRNDAEVYLEWERKLDFIFACQNYSEEKKVKLAAVESSDYALICKDELMNARRRNGEYSIASWDGMKRVMKKRFVPSYYCRELHQKLHKLTTKKWRCS